MCRTTEKLNIQKRFVAITPAEHMILEILLLLEVADAPEIVESLNGVMSVAAVYKVMDKFETCGAVTRFEKTFTVQGIEVKETKYQLSKLVVGVDDIYANETLAVEKKWAKVTKTLILNAGGQEGGRRDINVGNMLKGNKNAEYRTASAEYCTWSEYPPFAQEVAVT